MAVELPTRGFSDRIIEIGNDFKDNQLVLIRYFSDVPVSSGTL
jgi:hypothetical protein